MVNKLTLIRMGFFRAALGYWEEGGCCKKGFKDKEKNNILENDFKEVTLYEKPLRLIQKQILSKNLNMTTEDVEKDVIPVFPNKKESFLTLIISFPWVYKGKKYKLLLSKFRKNDIPSKEVINKLLKVYATRLFNFDYLEQYWKLEDKSNKNYYYCYNKN